MEEHRIGKLVHSKFVPEYLYYEATSRDVTQFNGCSQCDILPLCNGSCVARAYDSFGTYHAAGCYLEREFVEQRMRRFLKKKMEVGV
jgi:radical SAM protein with 4Fe4S-binding SPASM domain